MAFRCVFVGCGGISKAWFDLLTKMPEVEIVGLVDLKEEAARKRAEEFHLMNAAVGSNLGAMLEQVRPDVVLDCTVPEAHVAVTLEALKHGCHVLGEKPLADSMDNARKMVAAAQKAGKTYAVSQQRRYNPQIVCLRDFINSGALGPLTTVNCDFYIGAHFGGFRAEMRHVLLLDMAIHTFDAARFITGADPSAVYCHEWNPTASWYKYGASAVAVFEMTGGIVFTYRGSWCSEGLNTPWESEWRVIGERGSVSWDGKDGFRAQVVESMGKGLGANMRDVTLPPADTSQGTDDRALLFKDYFNCLKTGATPGTICTDNIKSLAMVFGAIESAESGRRVSL